MVMKDMIKECGMETCDGKIILFGLVCNITGKDYKNCAKCYCAVCTRTQCPGKGHGVKG